ncbi:MAG: tetraacyldisaccharide 4'-kinase [Alloprevotella sp.]|nr:tetraacyldisaccharide 4'-kinase [Alloprevotella sp.]
MVTWLRNRAFDVGLLPQEAYAFPVISVGNLAVGGTGKTPHVELLLSLLADADAQLCVLSRGYGRGTVGFREVTVQSSASEVGDEPLQIKRHFPQAVVCVCEDRREGIELMTAPLLKADKRPIVLLDDAFQHRYVKPQLQMLLTDYSRLYTRDLLLPAGRLRESKGGAYRADVVVVTKCPVALSIAEAAHIRAELKLKPHQQLFFSALSYGQPQPLQSATPPFAGWGGRPLVVSGIARPEPLHQYVRAMCQSEIDALVFPDHHPFTTVDLARIDQAAHDAPFVLTTAKDAARLADSAGLSDAVRRKLYVLPVSVQILLGQAAAFTDALRRAL